MTSLGSAGRRERPSLSPLSLSHTHTHSAEASLLAPSPAVFLGRKGEETCSGGSLHSPEVPPRVFSLALPNLLELPQSTPDTPQVHS